MKILRQKEFNSKAQKLIRDKALDKVAREAGIQKFISSNYRTIPNAEYKKLARQKVRENAFEQANGLHMSINEKSGILQGRWPYRTSFDKAKELVEYDHGNPYVPSRSVAAKKIMTTYKKLKG